MQHADVSFLVHPEEGQGEGVGEKYDLEDLSRDAVAYGEILVWSRRGDIEGACGIVVIDVGFAAATVASRSSTTVRVEEMPPFG